MVQNHNSARFENTPSRAHRNPALEKKQNTEFIISLGRQQVVYKVTFFFQLYAALQYHSFTLGMDNVGVNDYNLIVEVSYRAPNSEDTFQSVYFACSTRPSVSPKLLVMIHPRSIHLAEPPYYPDSFTKNHSQSVLPFHIVRDYLES